MMASVSILIPCHNAAPWLEETLDSCLSQRGVDVEVIVIDDGSTDNSLDILERYGQSIIVESGPNRGGNIARNRAFGLSSGQYIQYLDADDYILLGKLARQVESLERTGADVAYGDWRYLYDSGKRKTLSPVYVAGAQEDMVAALLSPWWVPVMVPLYRREAVRSAGGWDEQLRTGQDRAFILSVAMAGAVFSYEPGCYSIYRRHGNLTVSTATTRLWLDTTRQVLERFEADLRGEGQLGPSRRDALARTYFYIARKYYPYDPSMYHHLLRKCRDLGCAFAKDQPMSYQIAQRLLGYEGAELVAAGKRKASSILKTLLKRTD